SEETLAQRILTDLSIATAGIRTKKVTPPQGFCLQSSFDEKFLNFGVLLELYRATPGLVADRLKLVLEFVWSCLSQYGIRGIVFAYDEVQTMSDHAEKDQYHLSVLLDVFQSIQKKAIPFLLVFAGLPTLQPKVVATLTYAVRIFH